MGASVVWSQTPNEDGGEEPPGSEPEQAGEVDDSLPSRRLRHWLKAMFGGPPKPPEGRSGAER